MLPDHAGHAATANGRTAEDRGPPCLDDAAAAAAAHRDGQAEELRRLNAELAAAVGLPDDDCGWAADEVPVRAKVNGTTFRATYEVEDAIVLLASPEFGDASAALAGMAAEAVAARLLREMAETAMAHTDAPYLTDDEAKPVDP